ncbi:hypothetical protein [Granulicella arctica]|uniref:hypothetical protein n=1 Tax=Granulicella arctica TaxID=940613 RepID=UPI0021E036E3|nr:hypothetical protein [Granulicella arctica]
MRWAAVISVLLLLTASGCRRETVVERAARKYREKRKGELALAQLETVRFAGMTDPLMVRARMVNGLGLAVRPQKTELHAGEPLKVHLVYENFYATAPISAMTCQGFSIAVEDEASGDTASADVIFSCSKDDPLRDNALELPRGQLRSVDLSTADTDLKFDHPGQYIVTAAWRSFEPSAEQALQGKEYAVVQSNPVLITVQ